MQLTTIEQCRVGNIVYHPIWGKGEITLIDKFGKISKEVTVKFAHCKHYFFSGIGEGYNHISHLYTEPVYICRLVKNLVRNDSYEPVNPEQ